MNADTIKQTCRNKIENHDESRCQSPSAGCLPHFVSNFHSLLEAFVSYRRVSAFIGGFI